MSAETATGVVKLLVLLLTEAQRLGLDRDRLQAIFAEARAEARDVDLATLDQLEAESLAELDALDAALADRRAAEGGRAP